MRFVVVSVLCALSFSASAQNFNGIYFFGDSNTDSGRYSILLNRPGGTLATGQGAFTTNPDPEWSVALGNFFRLPVTPQTSKTPNGNNYAAGGATVATPHLGDGTANAGNAWSLQE